MRVKIELSPQKIYFIIRDIRFMSILDIFYFNVRFGLSRVISR